MSWLDEIEVAAYPTGGSAPAVAIGYVPVTEPGVHTAADITIGRAGTSTGQQAQAADVTGPDGPQAG